MQLTVDRPNVEMMQHLEGPIVDSFYEIALHSWSNRLEPGLPLLSSTYDPPRHADGSVRYLFQDHNPFFRDIEVLKAARAARKLLRAQTRDLAEERAYELEHGRERFSHTVRKAIDHQKQKLDDWAPREQARDAMKDLRDWGRSMSMQMGMSASRPGSRSNSRAPSRRSSTERVPRSKTACELIYSTELTSSR